MDDNFADDYPFSGATITTYGGRNAGTDTRNDTHIFKNGSTLVQYDGLDPCGPSSINKCVFETGSTLDFADSKPQVGTAPAHRPNFTRRVYSNYRFSSTVDKVYNETVASSGFAPEDSCVTDDFEIVSNRLVFANRGSFRLIIKGDLKLPAGGPNDSFLEFTPPFAQPQPPPLPNLNEGYVQLFFENTSPKSITGGSAINYLAKNSSFPIVISSGSTINCQAYLSINLVNCCYNGLRLESGSRLNMIGEYYVTGTASFNMNNDGVTLGIGSADGINTAPATSGNFRMAAQTFNIQQARYVYMGPTASQNTGTGLPSWTGAGGGMVLEIDKPNPTDVVILNKADDTTLVHELVLTSGRLNLNNKTLEVRVANTGAVKGKITATASGNLEISGQGTVLVTGSTDITAASDLDFYNLHTNTLFSPPYNINFLGPGNHRVHNHFVFRNNNSITNPPFYAAGSTLIYVRRTTSPPYTAGSEWADGVF